MAGPTALEFACPVCPILREQLLQTQNLLSRWRAVMPDWTRAMEGYKHTLQKTAELDEESKKVRRDNNRLRSDNFQKEEEIQNLNDQIQTLHRTMVGPHTKECSTQTEFVEIRDKNNDLHLPDVIPEHAVGPSARKARKRPAKKKLADENIGARAKKKKTGSLALMPRQESPAMHYQETLQEVIGEQKDSPSGLPSSSAAFQADDSTILDELFGFSDDDVPSADADNPPPSERDSARNSSQQQRMDHRPALEDGRFADVGEIIGDFDTPTAVEPVDSDGAHNPTNAEDLRLSDVTSERRNKRIFAGEQDLFKRPVSPRVIPKQRRRRSKVQPKKTTETIDAAVSLDIMDGFVANIGPPDPVGDVVDMPFSSYDPAVYFPIYCQMLVNVWERVRRSRNEQLNVIPAEEDDPEVETILSHMRRFPGRAVSPLPEESAAEFGAAYANDAADDDKMSSLLESCRNEFFIDKRPVSPLSDREF